MTEQCSICLSGLAEGLVITKCEHIFHQDCIARWIQECRPANGGAHSASCPQCRKSIKAKRNITKFRLNPLELVLKVLEEPEDYINSFDGRNKTKLRLGFSKLLSGKNAPNIQAPTKEKIGNEQMTKALQMMRSKIEQLESVNVTLGDEKREADRVKNRQMHKAHQLEIVNNQIGSRFSLESQKNRQLTEENIRLKSDSEALRKKEIVFRKKLKDTLHQQAEMKEKLDSLSHIEALSANVPENEVAKLDDLLEGKNDKQSLKVVKDFYLYLRSEHVQLKKEMKNVQQNEQEDLQCLRDQLNTYRSENNHLREENNLQAASVKKYKSRVRKLEAEKRNKENPTPTQNVDDSFEKKTPTLMSGGGFFPLKFDSADRVQKEIKMPVKKKAFFSPGNLKRKNPFAQKKNKRKPLRL